MTSRFLNPTFPVDAALVLEYISVCMDGGTPYLYTGDLSENTEAQFDAITWLDVRTKPAWSMILMCNYDSRTTLATYEGFRHMAKIVDDVINLEATVAAMITTLAGKADASHPITDVARTLDTAYQASATRDAIVVHSVEITSVANLSGGNKGEAYLEISADGSTDWEKTGGTVNNGNTVSIDLTATQVVSGNLAAVVPAGYYYRIKTNNLVGAPSYATGTGQETLI